MFELCGTSQQKEILTYQVFKDGNLFKSWTWNIYKNTQEFYDFIDGTFSIINDSIDFLDYIKDIIG